MIGGDGSGRCGPAGFSGHSGIVCNSDLDEDCRICGFSIGNGYCIIGCGFPLLADDDGLGGLLFAMALSKNGYESYFNWVSPM